MSESKIQQIFSRGFAQYLDAFLPSEVQYKAARSIMNCKTCPLHSHHSSIKPFFPHT